MRLGTIIAMPNEYSNYARVRDNVTGSAHTVDKGELPKDAQEGSEYAYKVEIWSNDSGLAHTFSEDD